MPERHDDEDNHGKDRDRRQQEGRVPIDRRQPSFTQGAWWQVSARKFLAARLICMWRKRLVSDAAVWELMRRLAP